ncbi:hypothetical protein ACTGUQ_11955 [Streptococcus suis]
MHSRTKSSIPLLLIRVNISAQWLIGLNSPGDCLRLEIGFAKQITAVRASHSKSDLYDCCEQVRSISNLKRFTEPFELCGGGSKIVQWTILYYSKNKN